MNNLEGLYSKRIPVAIIGLQNAGKTTFVQRLKSGNFQAVLPTAGVDTELVEIEGVLFQLFDLAGQRDFRSFIWENYVRLSRGIIFVIDSSVMNTGTKNLTEIKTWFWKAMEWNPSATLLILANKVDLKHMKLGKILDNLDLKRLPEINPDRSFRFFQVSTKTGQNIDEAMQWFRDKLSKEIGRIIVKLSGLYIYLPTGIPLTNISISTDLDSDLFTGFLSAINSFASNAMGESEGLQSIYTEKYRVLMVKRIGLLCGLITDKESDIISARIIAESVLKFLENKFSNEVQQFIENGKVVNIKENIISFLVKNFPESLPEKIDLDKI